MFAPKNARLLQGLQPHLAPPQPGYASVNSVPSVLKPTFSPATQTTPARRSRNTAAMPLRPHTNAGNSIPFRGLLHTSLDTPGRGSAPPARRAIIVIPFRIRTYAKHTRNPCRIRTSKTQDLKFFRMNTYEKTGRGDPPPTPLGYYSLFTTHHSLPSTVSAKSYARSASSYPPAPATPSTRACPNSPETAKSTTPATATPCVDTAATPETPDAPQSIPPSTPAPSPPCASISPTETRSSSPPSPPLRPASDRAAQSASSTAPASAHFLSRSCRNSSPASPARSAFPSRAAAPATRATRPRLSVHSAAAAFPLLHPKSCTLRAAESPSCAPALFCKSLPPARNTQSPPAPRCTPPSATENPATPDGATH